MLDDPRFADKITPEPNSGCWLWIAAQSNGYGRVDAKRYGTGLAHRVSYEMAKGKVPEGMELDHKCRVRCCVNPDHLEPVTQRENWLRGIAPPRLNLDKTHCPKGHELSARKGGGRKCVECEREHSRKQRADDPEGVKAYQAAYREAHREKLRAYAREYHRRKVA